MLGRRLLSIPVATPARGLLCNSTTKRAQSSSDSAGACAAGAFDAALSSSFPSSTSSSLFPPLPSSSSSSAANPVRRILLLRNGESTANVDLRQYCETPDWKIPLTALGAEQAEGAGRRLLRQLDGAPAYVYFSPYYRSLETMQKVIHAGPAGVGGGHENTSHPPDSTDIVHNDDNVSDGHLKPLNLVGIREDARLRDGDIGRFTGSGITSACPHSPPPSPSLPGTPPVTPLEELQQCLREREEYGKFFYRFPHGESGADVYDRVTSFLDAFQREKALFPPNTTVVMVTHGLTIRCFIKRWFHLNVDTFHQMTSPPPGQWIQLESHNPRNPAAIVTPPSVSTATPIVSALQSSEYYRLTPTSIKLLNLPSSLTEENGYAHRNKGALGSVSIGAPYI